MWGLRNIASIPHRIGGFAVPRNKRVGTGSSDRKPVVLGFSLQQRGETGIWVQCEVMIFSVVLPRVDHDVAKAFFRETAAFTAGDSVIRFGPLVARCRSAHKTAKQRRLFCLQVLPTKSSIVMTQRRASASMQPDRRALTGGSWLRARISQRRTSKVGPSRKRSGRCSTARRRLGRYGLDGAVLARCWI